MSLKFKHARINFKGVDRQGYGFVKEARKYGPLKIRPRKVAFKY